MADIVMPEMGSGVREGEVVKWHKAPGDRLAKGEAVVEIMVEKVTTDLESPVDGVLGEIFHHEGEIVAVGAVLASVRDG